MCGINGIFAYHYAAPAIDRDELRRTREAMQRRGPDGAGEWFSSDDRLGLGHRRLAIIDLDSRADQPMTSSCGRFVIVFNGEIYNYRELRTQCLAQGAQLRTESDTEVLLALYTQCGVAMFAQLRGMYALAVHDRHSGELLLARDPHGIKPLYVADDGWTLRFASSIKALLAGGRISRAVESAAQVGFLLLGSVPEPWTWYSAIRCLPAGHYCIVDASGPRLPVAHGQLQQGFAGSAANSQSDYAEVLARAVSDSVRAHQIADVPVGVFLSAGIDSGALLGLASAQQHGAVRAISLGFAEFVGSADDETQLAAQVAQHYGATQHIARVGQNEFAQLWPNFLTAMDQPSIDGLNTWLVSRAACAQGLKVALSGVGGDELLGGYGTFNSVPRWHRRLAIPARVPGLPALAQHIGAALGRHAGLHPKAAGLLRLGGTLAGCYLLQRGLFLPHELSRLLPPDRVREGLYRLNWLASAQADLQALQQLGATAHSQVGWLETRHYLRNQLLRDTDWAGMDHGLEIRTPLVDAQLSAILAPRLAQSMGGAGKQALAMAPPKALPSAIRQRAKTGFQTPLAQWQQQIPALDGWRRHRWLRAQHTPWARRYAASLLDLHA
jgi:asparagine synthase (glutamine-hydrolysing)